MFVFHVAKFCTATVMYSAYYKQTLIGLAKRYGKGAKSTKSKGQKEKRSFAEISPDEQWWLEGLWNGRLHRNREEAATMHR